MVCETCMTIVIYIINSVVLLLGLVLLVLGALITWGHSVIYNIVQPFLTNLSSSGVYKTSVDPAQITSYVLGLLRYVGWPTFLIGAIIMAIAVCGIVGACCGLRILLLAYVLVTYGITCALIAVCIAFYAADDQIDTFAKKYLMETLYPFNGTDATNVETVLWNVIQIAVKCCGVNNGTDFNSTLWGYNNGALQYPYTCCKLDSNLNPYDSACPRNHTQANSNYMIGCYTQLRTTVKSYSFVGLGVAVAIIVLEMTLMLFAACVCQAATKLVPGT